MNGKEKRAIKENSVFICNTLDLTEVLVYLWQEDLITDVEMQQLNVFL